jgi:hypothetical protein
LSGATVDVVASAIKYRTSSACCRTVHVRGAEKNLLVIKVLSWARAFEQGLIVAFLKVLLRLECKGRGFLGHPWRGFLSQ